MIRANTQSNVDQTMLDLNDAIDQLRSRDESRAHCSFCGKPHTEVNVLVPGPNSVFICDVCVDRATKFIGQRI